MLMLVWELTHRTYNKVGDRRDGTGKHTIVENRETRRSVEGIG